MNAARFEYHHRRARQHRLFALGATCAQVRLSHRRLAAAHWAVAAFIQTRRKRRPAGT